MLSDIINPSLKKKIAPSEKVTPSEEVEKGTRMLNATEQLVVTIRRKNLDNFQWQSTISTRWFNLDGDWSKEMFSTLEPDFYTIFKR